jgi:hypothetical protein
MDAAPVSRRVTTSVDLGDLRARLIEVSAAAGLGPSTWIRELVRRELSSDSPPAAAKTPVAVPSSEGVYRAWLDGELTAKLDVLTERGGFRTRAATLRAVLEGVNVGDANVSLSDAVAALGASNHHLVAMGRNINQIAKALHGDGGRSTTADVLALDQVLTAIHKHLDLAASLVGELRPMFKATAKGEAP